jgi:hypothetical protein
LSTDLLVTFLATAALASEASGQRGNSISARAGHSPEPGSSARAAALASEASGQRGNSISAEMISTDRRFLCNAVRPRRLQRVALVPSAASSTS